MLNNSRRCRKWPSNLPYKKFQADEMLFLMNIQSTHSIWFFAESVLFTFFLCLAIANIRYSFLAKNYLTLLSMPTITQWNAKLNTIFVWLFTTCKRRHIWAVVYRHSTRLTLYTIVYKRWGMWCHVCVCVSAREHHTSVWSAQATNEPRWMRSMWCGEIQLYGHGVRKPNTNTGFVGTAVIWFVDASQIFR